MRRILLIVVIVFILYWVLKGLAGRFFPDRFGPRRRMSGRSGKPAGGKSADRPVSDTVNYGDVRDVHYRDVDRSSRSERE